MIVYRACNEKYSDKLNGEGGLKSAGRWHKKGVLVVYASESLRVAKKEIQRGPAGKVVPDDHVFIKINIPDSVSVLEITREMLENVPWDENSYKDGPTQSIGSQLLQENNFAVIKVPSIVDDKSYNFLINPKHPQSSLIEIVP